MESNRNLVEALDELDFACNACEREMVEIDLELIRKNVKIIRAAMASPAAQPVEEPAIRRYLNKEGSRCSTCDGNYRHYHIYGPKGELPSDLDGNIVAPRPAQPPEDQPKAVEEEITLLKRRLEDQGNWYERRYNRLAKWAREELPEEQQVRFFQIMANGQPQAQPPEDQPKAQPEPFMVEGAWYERRDGRVERSSDSSRKRRSGRHIPVEGRGMHIHRRRGVECVRKGIAGGPHPQRPSPGTGGRVMDDMPEKVVLWCAINKQGVPTPESGTWANYATGAPHIVLTGAPYIRADLVAAKDANIKELDELVDDLSGGMCVINGQARACSPAVEARIAELEAEVERAFREGVSVGQNAGVTGYQSEDTVQAAWAAYQATRHPKEGGADHG